MAWKIERRNMFYQMIDTVVFHRHNSLYSLEILHRLFKRLGIRLLQYHPIDDVIVVNDGCTDSTASILADIKGITVVTLGHNSGKGTALKTGFRKALEMGFSYAITLDADGQHFPEDIPLMLKANIENPGAFIVGERKLLILAVIAEIAQNAAHGIRALNRQIPRCPACRA